MKPFLITYSGYSYTSTRTHLPPHVLQPTRTHLPPLCPTTRTHLPTPMSYNQDTPPTPISYNQDTPPTPVSYNQDTPPTLMSYNQDTPPTPMSYNQDTPPTLMSYNQDTPPTPMSYNQDTPPTPVSRSHLPPHFLQPGHTSPPPCPTMWTHLHILAPLQCGHTSTSWRPYNVDTPPHPHQGHLQTFLKATSQASFSFGFNRSMALSMGRGGLQPLLAARLRAHKSS